ncbi:MAG: gamma-glutamyltransferase, partial [Rhodanobacter sp.]
RFGKLPFAELFDDAIEYAREGHPVAPTVAAGWDGLIDNPQRDRFVARITALLAERGNA